MVTRLEYHMNVCVAAIVRHMRPQNRDFCCTPLFRWVSWYRHVGNTLTFQFLLVSGFPGINSLRTRVVYLALASMQYLIVDPIAPESPDSITLEEIELFTFSEKKLKNTN